MFSLKASTASIATNNTLLLPDDVDTISNSETKFTSSYWIGVGLAFTFATTGSPTNYLNYCNKNQALYTYIPILEIFLFNRYFRCNVQRYSSKVQKSVYTYADVLGRAGQCCLFFSLHPFAKGEFGYSIRSLQFR